MPEKCAAAAASAVNPFAAARACQAHGGKAAHLLPPLCKGRWAADAARRGCCVPPNGITQAFLALTVNPSVSLTADSSPCTGEPGADFPAENQPFPTRMDRVCRAAQGSRGRVQVRTACESRQLKFLLPAFLFQKPHKAESLCKSVLPGIRDN